MTKKIKKTIKIETVNETKTMAKARDEFILNCRARNLVNETILNYEKATRYFMDFVGEEFDIYAITSTDVDNYIADCLERTIGNTARSYCKLLKVFFRYHDLDIHVNTPGENFTFKEIYSDEEIEKMLQPPKRRTFVTMRDHAIVCFFLATGVRRSTIISVRIRDLDFDKNLIFLDKTKTKKQYYIPMSTQLKSVLKKYLSCWRYNEDMDYLFPNQFGEQLGKHGMSMIIRRYNRERGVTTSGVHRFRNTYATNYVKNKGDVFHLQQLLGHSKIETTRRYVTLDIDDLQVDYDTFNILDNFEMQRFKKKTKIETTTKSKTKKKK